MENDTKINYDFRTRISTDREGHFTVNKILSEVPFWFNLSEDSDDERNVLRTNNIVFKSGEKYKVKLRIDKKPDNVRQLALESIHDSTGCRIDQVNIKQIEWASKEDEERVRRLLRKYNDANQYWLKLYPKDLPKFGYTFHQQKMEDRILKYEDVKAADNWYAEFYRKGISYIGVSRLLAIDIDGLRCTRVAEHAADNTTPETLEFDFVLKQAWMNAVGNGIGNTWHGWFNGVVDKGTAIFNTKTNTLIGIRTKFYDERYSDYYELKSGCYVPRRIVIDYHQGKKDEADSMFFDFRFKVYEPCLWLFDRSVTRDEKDLPVWIDNVFIEDKPATEMK
jgi:hypothetical protein